MAPMRTILALLLLATLYVASLVLFPVEKVEVVGLRHLKPEDLLRLARAYPKAKALRYTPAGFWVVLDQSTLFAPEVRFLLEYAQVERPSASRVYLYSWGVSVRP
jgi:cell division protein FtsQ